MREEKHERLERLERLIARVDQLVAEADNEVGSFPKLARNWSDYHGRRRAAFAKVEAVLVDQEGASVREGSDGHRFRMAGVAATSTGGLRNALHNWIRAAQRRIEKESANG